MMDLITRQEFWGLVIAGFLLAGCLSFAILAKLDGIISHLSGIQDGLGNIESQLSSISGDVDTLSSRFYDVEEILEHALGAPPPNVDRLVRTLTKLRDDIDRGAAPAELKAKTGDILGSMHIPGRFRPFPAGRQVMDLVLALDKGDLVDLRAKTELALASLDPPLIEAAV
jgi:hypothetical protein